MGWERFLGIMLPILIALFLTSVSSGTFLVAVSSAYIFLFMISVSLSGGMFGISTLMMFIPPFIVIVCLGVLKINWGGSVPGNSYK